MNDNFECCNKESRNMKYFKKLLGDRIYLSPRNSGDIEIFTKWLNDFQVTDYTARSSQVLTLDGEKQYLEQHINDGAYFAIVTLDNNEMIGTVSLEKIDYLNRNSTLGIFIGESEYRNKGYGSEAINLILDYGFNYLNMYSIELRVLEFNSIGIACYKKCGFKEIGRRRKEKFINGKYYDTIYMDILKEEFENIGKEYIRNKNIV